MPLPFGVKEDQVIYPTTWVDEIHVAYWLEIDLQIWFFKGGSREEFAPVISVSDNERWMEDQEEDEMDIDFDMDGMTNDESGCDDLEEEDDDDDGVEGVEGVDVADGVDSVDGVNDVDVDDMVEDDDEFDPSGL
ncbi:hypothetical protein NHQ30_005161 [Ciborinia camelliae]|nr:hypothetical protein NHQ30_005161 [Ciborinia camelliae]